MNEKQKSLVVVEELFSLTTLNSITLICEKSVTKALFCKKNYLFSK